MKHSAIDQEQYGELDNHAEDIRDRLHRALLLVDQIVKTPVSVEAMAISEEDVRAALRLRRNRDRFFDPKLFADPAWDILLELYAADLGQRRVSVTSLCIGAAVPATTALRWIRALEGRGMLRRTPDLMDARRVFVSISPDAAVAMERFFSGAPCGAVLT